ncbi:LADA_0E13586g1_1 [Lachancea dasiensis]|uniref:LADA_0E13586g1_1 n=1 Tax=Lachancea dasiensis TaxID=1072105 RepID=A0A1G4JFT3_9SACH|nr:LADA_0E13586g1_1 [Lachancea dasiensis]
MSDIALQLAAFSTCDVSDCLLNMYGDPEGGYIPNLHQWSGQHGDTLVGQAYTVLFAPHDDPRPEINYIDAVPEGSVVVMALTLPMQLEAAPYVRISQAMYGGLMSRRAQNLGAKGTIVFGRIRDLAEHRELNFPVYSYALGTCSPKMAVKPVAVQVRLHILCCEAKIQNIRPGDYMVGDENGIVRIPTEKVVMQDFFHYMHKSVAADRLIAQDVAEGKPLKSSQNSRRAVLKNVLSGFDTSWRPR